MPYSSPFDAAIIATMPPLLFRFAIRYFSEKAVCFSRSRLRFYRSSRLPTPYYLCFIFAGFDAMLRLICATARLDAMIALCA